MKPSNKFYSFLFVLILFVSLVIFKHVEAFAEPVEINNKWICETGEGSDIGITQVKIRSAS